MESGFSTELAQAACPPGVVLIWVSDGLLMPRCGCLGVGELNQVATPQAPLVCHVSGAGVGQRIIFQGQNLQASHQFFFSNLPLGYRAASLVFGVPSEAVSESVYVDVLALPPATGSYAFRDEPWGVSGSLIVP